MSAQAAKRTGLLALAVASLQPLAVAHGAPIPNLVLTCSDENAIGQNQDACHGIWAYQIPTGPLIVSAGPSGIWRVFGDLIGADTVYVHAPGGARTILELSRRERRAPHGPSAQGQYHLRR